MVSLPSKWVKEHHIQKGHELNVEEKEYSLVIHSGDVTILEKAELNLAKKDQFLKRYLRSLYHRGFAEVKITCEEGIDIQEIKKELDTYLGFEIIEQGKKYCIIRNVADTMEKEFSIILRKIFLMNATMADDSLSHIRSSHYAALHDTATIERTNNKLVNLSYRVLNKSGKLSDQELMSLYTILLCLENIADFYRDLCDYAAKKKIKLGKDLDEFYAHINLHYHQLAELYYKFDPAKMLALRDQRTHLEQKAHELHEKMNSPAIVHYLRSILNYMKDMELCIGFGSH